jgi:uncharacterized membrane protein YbhN (UPF0104 family)
VTLLQAHLVCITLVAADLVARIWRIKWIVRGLGYQVTAKDALVLNTFGDAANSLTPLRIGGEPARLAGMLRTRVPITAGLLGITLEAVVSRLVLAVAIVWFTWQFAPDWWAGVGPRLLATGADAGLWLGLFLLAGVLLWSYARRVVSPMTRGLSRSMRRVRVYWRRMPRWPLIVGIPLSLVSIITRVAILPVLALSLPNPPPLSVVTFGSFALLYSQMVLPTPSGAGVVELGFLGGAAGEFSRGGWLLATWRFYTTGLGVLLGVGFAAKIYGWPALRKVVQRGTMGFKAPAR